MMCFANPNPGPPSAAIASERIHGSTESPKAMLAQRSTKSRRLNGSRRI
jgi:hypothetical protein